MVRVQVPYERANKENKDYNERLEAALVDEIKAQFKGQGIGNVQVEAGENPEMTFTKLSERVNQGNWKIIQKQFKTEGAVLNKDKVPISKDLASDGFDYSTLTKAKNVDSFKAALLEAKSYHGESIFMQNASKVTMVYDKDRQGTITIEKKAKK